MLAPRIKGQAPSPDAVAMNTAETWPAASASGAAPAANRAATTSAAPEPAAHSSGVPASLGASSSAPAAIRASTTATLPANLGEEAQIFQDAHGNWQGCPQLTATSLILVHSFTTMGKQGDTLQARFPGKNSSYRPRACLAVRARMQSERTRSCCSVQRCRGAGIAESQVRAGVKQHTHGAQQTRACR